MKKLLAVVMSVFLILSLAACSGGESSGGDEVSVFYYTYSDTYISSVRSAMDKLLKENGISFNNYDANGNQTTQTEQVTTAIAKGSKLLIVNVVDTGSNDAAQNIIDMAKAKDIPVIFFNRSVEQSVVESYDKCVFVGTDYEMAGHMQGEMIGNYLVANYDAIDLNGDGVISYVMFKGQEGNMEADARTQYGVEDADAVLTGAGKAQLSFYANNTSKYLVDQNGAWSAAQGQDYMQTILAQYSEANNNMVELVIANNDDMALGAIDACTEAGLGKSSLPFIVGVDATPPAMEALREGTLEGTVRNDAVGLAESLISMAVSLSSEGTPPQGMEVTDGSYVWLRYEAVTAEQPEG